MSTPRPSSGDLLLDAYDRVAVSVPAVLEDLSPAQAAWRPDPDANSIGWLVWHLTRVLDDHLAAAFDVAQVHESDGWAGRLGLDRDADATGYGDTPDDVARVRFDHAEGGVATLAAYHAAVQDQAARLLDDVDGEALARVVDDRWDPPVTLAVRLVSVGDDMARHVGQAELLRGLVERA